MKDTQREAIIGRAIELAEGWQNRANALLTNEEKDSETDEAAVDASHGQGDSDAAHRSEFSIPP